MKCGEFEKRNKEYWDSFDIEKYFESLVMSRNDAGVVIFDVGAHKGESAKFFNSLFPDAKIYSFEPNPMAAKVIEELKINNVEVLNIALSDQNGTGDFYVQDISHLSSLNSINKYSNASMGYAEREKHSVVQVEIKRGDQFCKENNISHINFLKVDVQANEVATLAGFGGMISDVDCIFVEVSLYDFYMKKSNIHDIEEVLPNFELFDIYEISKNSKTMGTDWATLVYKRSSHP